MTGAHVMGVPLEESVLALAPAGAVTATAVVVIARNGLARMRMRLRRGAVIPSAPTGTPRP